MPVPAPAATTAGAHGLSGKGTTQMKGFLYFSAYNNIVETLHMNAAPGRVLNGDGNSCGNSLAKASRDAKADTALFLASARQFLSTADARSCSVTSYDPAWSEYFLGFRTQRYGDYLYVTGVTGETRLEPGMRIVSAGRTKISELAANTGYEIFNGRGTDREDWDLALRMFDDIDVFPGNDRVERLDLRRFPLTPATPTFHFSTPADNTCVLSVGSLDDAAKVRGLIASARPALSRASRLIVDLRHCEGKGSPEAWLALLPFLCDKPAPAASVMADKNIFTLYTADNVDRLCAALQAGATDAEGQLDPYAEELMGCIREKGSQVLAAVRKTFDLREREEASELAEVLPSPFQAGEVFTVDADVPENVLLLVGPSTGEGAERLAEAVMGMGKVRLVGRATLGLVDYANYLVNDYPDIKARFIYPISRTAENRAGNGYALTGLPLDVHVPFQPGECMEDAVMEEALQL